MGSQHHQDDAVRAASDLVDSYQNGRISRRQFGKGLIGLGIGATAASVILAACGGSSSKTTATTPAGGSTAGTTAGTPKVGGTLREGYNRDISKLDPITTNWYDPAFSAIYETIVTDDPDGKTVAQFAKPFTISSDGLTYTFEIPEGRTSHSGGAMGAKQIADVLTTIKEKSFIGGVSTVPMEGYSVEGNNVILKMKNAWLGALNPHKTGYWALLNIDTWTAAGGLDPKSTVGTASADGTGPFTFGEFVPGSHMLVNRWDKYPVHHQPGEGLSRRHPLECHHRGRAAGNSARGRRTRHLDRAQLCRSRTTEGKQRPHSHPAPRMVGLPAVDEP
jgi:ABC-type transport system substrate-binding protein